MLTTTEVAQRLRVTRKTVAVWIREGRLRAVRAGRPWLIPASAVDELLAKGGYKTEGAQE